ncbi:rhodanese-like domain-containing protein [Anaerobacillus alkaliphilus]|uniref:Rhodanese-like domain-containing protein n=1 Tax=Anaerobacillus alkaliphilus TaxID=1548597 RepID=A0A4V1LFX7_9BACI|nr:rhodanese-like domain-containing protein [Anaerobacillus alkaliphilus]RXI97804.1 rhodanese-like domain-containing protein [Anaerobacillus alkaliphilus]
MSIKKISPKELMDKLNEDERIFLVDVRAEDKYNTYHIEDVNIEGINIPKTIIFNLSDEDSIEELPVGKEIIVTCSTGNSATKCAAILSAKNFDVAVLEGGITAWKEYAGK